MKNSLYLNFAMATATVLLAACSAHVDGVGSGSPAPQAPSLAVKDLGLEGVWKSDCGTDPLSHSARTVKLTLNGDSAEYKISRFNGNQCQGQVTDETVKGKPEILRAYGDSKYLLKITIPIDANASTWRLFDIQAAGPDLLKISEFFVNQDEAGQSKLDTDLKRIASAPVPTNGAVYNLGSGYYVNTEKKLCAMSVSTASIGGQVQTVYLDADQNCNRYRDQFKCNGNSCASQKNPGWTLVMTSDSSFTLSDDSGEAPFNFKMQ